MRTQQGELVTKHLETSREIFLALLKKVRSVDAAKEQSFIDARDYEGLERYLLLHIMGM